MASNNEERIINIKSVEAKRAANFTSGEVNYLLQLVENKKNIIECKKTDRTTAAEKNLCWTEIQEKFCAKFGVFRASKTLKIKYENMKKNAKKNFALEKKETYKTGGGKKAQSNITETDENIIQMLQIEQVEGLPSLYDDDKIEEVSELKDSIEDDGENFEKSFAECTPHEDGLKQKWEKYTPSMLKAQKHPALATEKKRTRDVWADVALVKIKKYELEMKVIEEEANLKKIKLELEIEDIKHRIGKCANCPRMLNIYPKEF